MPRPDDSTLAPADRRFVEERASLILDEAAAWDRFPVPVDDILEVANLRVAPTSAFDIEAIVGYAKTQIHSAAARIKSAIGKVFGLYDARASVIHIDRTVVKSKQQFVTLHETGHHELPTHRRMFRFFQDSRHTLAPDVADQFEREANNFARFLLFKGTTFADHAADHPLALKTPLRLAKKFGASGYASAREFVRTNHRSCALIVLNPIETVEETGLRAPVRRTEASAEFEARFGRPSGDDLTPGHVLWPVIPQNRRMTAPQPVMLRDRNGQRHICYAEAFDSTYNIFILLHPAQTLTVTTVALPTPARAVSF